MFLFFIILLVIYFGTGFTTDPDALKVAWRLCNYRLIESEKSARRSGRIPKRLGDDLFTLLAIEEYLQTHDESKRNPRYCYTTVRIITAAGREKMERTTEREKTKQGTSRRWFNWSHRSSGRRDSKDVSSSAEALHIGQVLLLPSQVCKRDKDWDECSKRRRSEDPPILRLFPSHRLHAQSGLTRRHFSWKTWSQGTLMRVSESEYSSKQMLQLLSFSGAFDFPLPSFSDWRIGRPFQSL